MHDMYTTDLNRLTGKKEKNQTRFNSSQMKHVSKGDRPKDWKILLEGKKARLETYLYSIYNIIFPSSTIHSVFNFSYISIICLYWIAVESWVYRLHT